VLREATHERHAGPRPCLDALPRRPRARASHRPLTALVAPLAHASAPALNVVAAILAAALVGAYAALVGAYVALAVLLIVAVLRVVRSRPDGHR